MVFVGHDVLEEAKIPDRLAQKLRMGKPEQSEEEGIRIHHHSRIRVENQNPVLGRLEEPPVTQFRGGQGFGAGKVFQGKREIARSLHQERDLVVLKKIRFSRVNNEHAADVVLAVNGKSRATVEAVLFHLVAPQEHGRIRERVVANVRSVFPECRSGRAPTLRPVIGENPNRAQIPAVIPPYGHGFQQTGFRIGPSDPGHPESALLDECLADFVEQLAAGRRPGDNSIDLAERGMEAAKTDDFMLMGLKGRDVGADGHVLKGLSPAVEERHDRRVHPEERTILGPVFDCPFPDLPLLDRLPQLAHEFFRMKTRINDAVVLPDQLAARILRDRAELVVY